MSVEKDKLNLAAGCFCGYAGRSACTGWGRSAFNTSISNVAVCPSSASSTEGRAVLSITLTGR